MSAGLFATSEARCLTVRYCVDMIFAVFVTLISLFFTLVSVFMSIAFLDEFAFPMEDLLVLAYEQFMTTLNESLRALSSPYVTESPEPFNVIIFVVRSP